MIDELYTKGNEYKNEYEQRLDDAQRSLAELYMPRLRSLIYKHIFYNKNIYGFEYDDIFQEGCICLCRAAMTFKSTNGTSFTAYADKVIINGLKSYCRSIYNKEKMCCNLSDIPDYTIDRISMEAPKFEDINEHDIFKLLDTLKKEYAGIALRGIEALELKCSGYTGTEIAAMYKVKPNTVGAWISRAVQKLKKNADFMLWMEHFAEGGAA